MTRHVSSLELDALALGGLRADDARRVSEHLAACVACRAEQSRAESLRADFERIAAVRPVSRHAWARMWWLAVPSLAAVVALALWSIRPWAPKTPDLEIKGDATWQVIAKHGATQTEVRDGSTLSPGDQIRFVIVPAGARYVMIASVDATGVMTIYYPYDGAQSEPIAGERVALPGSIVLDDAPGPERVYALLTDAPLSAAVVKQALERVVASGRSVIRTTRALHVPVRAQLSILFEKAVP